MTEPAPPITPRESSTGRRALYALVSGTGAPMMLLGLLDAARRNQLLALDPGISDDAAVPIALSTALLGGLVGLYLGEELDRRRLPTRRRVLMGAGLGAAAVTLMGLVLLVILGSLPFAVSFGEYAPTLSDVGICALCWAALAIPTGTVLGVFLAVLARPVPESAAPPGWDFSAFDPARHPAALRRSGYALLAAVTAPLLLAAIGIARQAAEFGLLHGFERWLDRTPALVLALAWPAPVAALLGLALGAYLERLRLTLWPRARTGAVIGGVLGLLGLALGAGVMGLTRGPTGTLDLDDVLRLAVKAWPDALGVGLGVGLLLALVCRPPRAREAKR